VGWGCFRVIFSSGSEDLMMDFFETFHDIQVSGPTSPAIGTFGGVG
jgi:hypothetical protein